MRSEVDRKLSVFAAAEELPDAIAIRDNGSVLTYQQVSELVKREVLDPQKQPLYPLVARPDLATVVKVLALLEKKQPMLLLHPGLTEHEKKLLLDSISSLNAELPANAAVILFTSGTTGLPKPAVLTREALVASAESSRSNLPLSPGDVWQLSISPARIGGFSILTRSLIARSAVALGPKFEPEEFVRRLIIDQVTYSSIVPTMLRMLFDRFPDWRPPKYLRSLLVGGAPTSSALRNMAKRREVPIILTYGMTETASNVVSTPFDERYCVGIGSGKANNGAEIQVVNGHLLVRGPMLMSGYWGREPLKAGEWFDSGDIGEIDEQGYVKVFARRRDMILSGGENVYPAEVEEALEALPGIKEALVLGLPDEKWGAIVTALLVAEDPKHLPTKEEIIRGLRPLLALYKSPRRVAWVDCLPVTTSGKPDRDPKRLSGLNLDVLHYKT